MSAYFPIFLNIEKKKFLVFGAGRIASRRIRALLKYGAGVRVTAPRIHEAVMQLQKMYPGQLQTEQRVYCMGEIQNTEADFVLAATDDKKVNACIFRECRDKKIPVNNASDRSQCDFYFPALVEQDHLVAGVTSTDGDHKKAAAFSRKLRELNWKHMLAERDRSDL